MVQHGPKWSNTTDFSGRNSGFQHLPRRARQSPSVPKFLKSPEKCKKFFENDLFLGQKNEQTVSQFVENYHFGTLGNFFEKNNVKIPFFRLFDPCYFTLQYFRRLDTIFLRCTDVQRRHNNQWFIVEQVQRSCSYMSFSIIGLDDFLTLKTTMSIKNKKCFSRQI